MSNGGTVLMTAYSAKVDEHGQWFDTPLPGRLSDVFGLKTNAFYQVDTDLKIELEGEYSTRAYITYELLEPSTATVARAIHEHSRPLSRCHTEQVRQRECDISRNRVKGFGTRTPSRPRVQNGGNWAGSANSRGVYARVVEGRTLYVNTTGQQKKILIVGQRRESSPIAYTRGR